MLQGNLVDIHITYKTRTRALDSTGPEQVAWSSLAMDNGGIVFYASIAIHNILVVS